MAFFSFFHLRFVASQSSSTHTLRHQYPLAGLFSGLVSHVVVARFRFPQLVSRLVSATTRPESRAMPKLPLPEASPNILPSLGASGAIYATVTLTALAFPDTEIALLIPPTFPIPIQWGVGAFVAIDILGVFRGWRWVFYPELKVIS